MSEKEVENKTVDKKTAQKPAEKKTAQKPVEKKPGFFQRAKRSARASINELKKVHWPNRKELVTYTGVVISSVAVVAVMIWIVDSIIANLFGLLMR